MAGSGEHGVAEKAAWRERFRRVRRGLGEAGRAAASAQIVARLLALPEVAAARTVHTFWPLADEPDVRPLAHALRQRGVAVVLPAVRPGRRLAHRAFEGEGRLVPGPYGTREPHPAAPAVPPDRLDVVLVPGLAMGRDGSRLGYGAGYYDAFLAGTPALRVGVAFGACLTGGVPSEPHDARLHLVVTEAETVRVASPA